MGDYKVHADLAKDNCGGLDALETPNTFSNNPGFISPIARTGALSPSRGMVHSTRPQQSVLGAGKTMGRTASRGFGSVSNPSPGSVDPGNEGGPLTLTSGYNG